MYCTILIRVQYVKSFKNTVICRISFSMEEETETGSTKEKQNKNKIKSEIVK